MGFNLNQIEMRKYAEEGKFFDVLHPVTGEPLIGDDGKKVQIKIGGADASRIKSAVEERETARRAEAQKAVAAGEPVPVRSWKEQEDDMIDDLVLLTEDWTDNFELDDDVLPFSKENAELLYRRFPEIAAQMRDRAVNRLNFMPTSANG